MNYNVDKSRAVAKYLGIQAARSVQQGNIELFDQGRAVEDAVVILGDMMFVNPQVQKMAGAALGFGILVEIASAAATRYVVQNFLPATISTRREGAATLVTNAALAEVGTQVIKPFIPKM